MDDISEKKIAKDSECDSPPPIPIIAHISHLKGQPEKPKQVTVFDDIFTTKNWIKYISALEKTEPPLINENREFIGKPRKHIGVICSWIKYLQVKGIIKQNVNRIQLSSVLNNEIKNFDMGSDGKTFDNISNEFDDNYKDQLIELTK